VGTLGSGNHYLEIQTVDPDGIFDTRAARRLGIGGPGQVVLMLHTGSRGFGHQVASDYLRIFNRVMGAKYGMQVRDKQLACAPFHSEEGQAYFAAMQCAVNMAFMNRQMILHRVREVFSDVLGKSAEDLGLEQIYDVTHNTAKVEHHVVEGEEREVLIHRKGATRAFGPRMDGIPSQYADLGQPVIIGGSMETGSCLLLGLFVRAKSKCGLAEEAGAAYKDIDAVVESAEAAGLSRRVVRLRPVGSLKG
jgi:tRNA-splicing ligase RtcB